MSRELFALVRQESAAGDGENPVRSLIGEAGWGLRWDAARSQLAHLIRALRK